MVKVDQEQHVVEYVEGYLLPPGQDWAMAQTDDAYYLFLRKGAIRPEVLEQAWSAFRLLSERPAHRNEEMRQAVLRGISPEL